MGVRATPAARQRATAIITGVVTLALIVAILIAVSRASGPGPDARAYPADRGSVTLTGALRRAHVIIPDCLTDTLRYAVPGPSRDLYLLLTGPKPCVDRFVQLNGLTDDGTAGTLPAWATDDRAAALGWTLDPGLGFRLHTASPAPDHEIEALIRELSDRSAYTAYVRAT